MTVDVDRVRARLVAMRRLLARDGYGRYVREVAGWL